MENIKTTGHQKRKKNFKLNFVLEKIQPDGELLSFLYLNVLFFFCIASHSHYNISRYTITLYRSQESQTMGME